MGLEDKIKESIILAMKAKDKTRLEALRAIKSAILLEKTKAGNKENLDENQIIKLLQKLVKQRNESAKIYKEQNRAELAEIEDRQSKIISEYLPEQLNEEEEERADTAAPGPTREQVEAAGQMTADERGEMIRGMVERLANRLESAPDDIEGWKRLGNARRVLGELTEAEEAYGRALDLRPSDVVALEAQAQIA